MAPISSSDRRSNGSLPFWGRLLCCLCLAVSLFGQRASAHPMPQSFVELRAAKHGWHLHLRLPADRLEVAFVQAGLVPDPGPGNDTRPALSERAVRTYVEDRLDAHGPDGQPWTLELTDVVPPQGTIDEWQIDADLSAPAGAAADSAWLDYEVIVREIATHTAVVSIVQDWSGGVLPGEPRLLGNLGGEAKQIRVDRAQGHAWRAWSSMVVLGVRHILEGVDHLAFLVTLILTVPLQAVARKWQPREGLRPAVINTLRWVSAFTLGHSASLFAASMGWVAPPGQWVEVLIAISVGISAAHALRPLYPDREAWIAGGFGLVHGLAFSSAIRELSLPTGQIVVATLGFNLGIELVQLALVLLLVPVFVFWRDKTWTTWGRYGIGVSALGAATVWAAARAASL